MPGGAARRQSTASKRPDGNGRSRALTFCGLSVEAVMKRSPNGNPRRWASRAAIDRARSALALHLLVGQPLELEYKWMKEGHLTLCHHQARDIRVRRYPPLCTGNSAPIEL